MQGRGELERPDVLEPSGIYRAQDASRRASSWAFEKSALAETLARSKSDDPSGTLPVISQSRPSAPDRMLAGISRSWQGPAPIAHPPPQKAVPTTSSVPSGNRARSSAAVLA